MLEEQLKTLWQDQYEDLFFETNAYCHFNMISTSECSELFESCRSQIQETFHLIKTNLSLALTSEHPYLRLFAELISKTLA